MRFGKDAESQRTARSIIEAMREGERDRRAGKPSHFDRDGTPVYRILLCGLAWMMRRAGVYVAADGYERRWRVERTVTNKWRAYMIERAPGDPKEPVTVHDTFRLARTHAEERARRMKWREGCGT